MRKKIVFVFIVLLVIVVLIAELIRRDEDANISELTTLENTYIPKDVSVYEEHYYVNSKRVYYEAIETQQEFYENMADSYEVVEDSDLVGISVFTITGEWVDEEVRNAAIIAYDAKSLSANFFFIELSTDTAYSKEEFEDIVSMVTMNILKE